MYCKPEAGATYLQAVGLLVPCSKASLLLNARSEFPTNEAVVLPCPIRGQQRTCVGGKRCGTCHRK